MSLTTLHLLSAGAAQGVVRALEPALREHAGIALSARFGAVGAMKEALLAGEPCDAFISTARMVADLVADGLLQPEPVLALGRVRTGIAVRAGDARPAIGSANDLREALRAAPAVHFPDPERATAGIHFARVLGSLGLADELRGRLRTFANGATAMAELARCGLRGAIGCTQVSEILCTEGAQLVGPLPAEFELATAYVAAVPLRRTAPDAAARFVEWLGGEQSRAKRDAGGFEN